MSIMDNEKVSQFFETVKERGHALKEGGKEKTAKTVGTVKKSLIDFRIVRLSRFSNKALMGMGAGALCLVIAGGTAAFALSPTDAAAPAVLGVHEDTVLLAKASAVISDVELQPYWTIKINGSEVLAVATEEDAKAVLDGLTAKYKSEGTEILEVSYKENVEVASVGNPTYKPDILGVDDALNFLVTGSKEPVSYTIQEGDSLWDIALANGMTVEELIAANPGADAEHLKIGTAINLFQVKPFINVVTKEKLVATENVDYPIVYEETNTLYRGEIKVKSAGTYGQRQVTSEVVKENGVVVSTTEVASETIAEPKAQVALKGTKALSTYVGSGSGSFGIPMGKLEVSSPFGSRGGGRHTGVDLRNPRGTAIYVMDDGVVTCASYRGSYGNIVKVSHGNGLETWYAHCDTIAVSVGDQVKKGQQIATVGMTGRATGYHLHLEVRVNGNPQNPMNYL